MLCPTKIKDRLEIFFPLSMSRDDIIKASFGRWLVGEPIYNLNRTWQAIREGMEARRITATGLKSSTGRYNPTSSGPGPVTAGAISIFTTEEDINTVGFEVIKIVKHDIQYKEVSADGLHRHRGDRKFIKKTLHWNKGDPSFTGQGSAWCKNLRDKYKWHLNVVKSPNLDEHCDVARSWRANSKIEYLTDLWHSLSDQILSGMLGPVKMDCTERKRKKNSRGWRETHHFVLISTTAEESVKLVEDALASNTFVESYEVIKNPKVER